MDGRTTASTIDEYIAGFPPEVREKLETVRRTIHAAAPEAVETISYSMPTFDLLGHVVHFAAFTNHIGLYPTPSGMVEFEAELEPYKAGKGSLRFPFDQPLPLDLISRIVRFRAAENVAKAAKKRPARRAPRD
jgi:uncharacterized protein YdhG (YjbR/CyaY superfamily)